MACLSSSNGASSIKVGKIYYSDIKRWLGHIRNIVSNSDHHTTRRMWRLWREFTRMLPGISYEERLNKQGLFSLERQRLRGNLIEVYKIMRGIDR